MKVAEDGCTDEDGIRTGVRFPDDIATSDRQLTVIVGYIWSHRPIAWLGS
jgi:hypothetical protein